MMKTNLHGTFWLAKKALEQLAQGGSIIITRSVQAATASPELID